MGDYEASGAKTERTYKTRRAITRERTTHRNECRRQTERHWRTGPARGAAHAQRASIEPRPPSALINGSLSSASSCLRLASNGQQSRLALYHHVHPSVLIMVYTPTNELKVHRGCRLVIGLRRIEE